MSVAPLVDPSTVLYVALCPEAVTAVPIEFVVVVPPACSVIVVVTAAPSVAVVVITNSH